MSYLSRRFAKMTENEPYYLAVQNHHGFIGTNPSTWSWEGGVPRSRAVCFDPLNSTPYYDPERAYAWAAKRNLKLHKIPVELRPI